jgi:hypothetical protein
MGCFLNPFPHLRGAVPLHGEELFAYLSVLMEDAFLLAGTPRGLSRILSRGLSEGLGFG